MVARRLEGRKRQASTRRRVSSSPLVERAAAVPLRAIVMAAAVRSASVMMAASRLGVPRRLRQSCRATLMTGVVARAAEAVRPPLTTTRAERAAAVVRATATRRTARIRPSRPSASSHREARARMVEEGHSESDALLQQAEVGIDVLLRHAETTATQLLHERVLQRDKRRL